MKKTLLSIALVFMCVTLFAQTQFDAPFKTLPKDTQKYVTKNYAGWAVDKCVQEDNTKQKMTSCDVYVSKGTEKLKLIFDKDGQFVKKETITEQPKAAAPAAAAPVAAPVAAPAAAPVVAPATAPVAAPVVAPVVTPVVTPAVVPAAVPDTTKKK
jgi:hypothetical protein